MSHTGKSRITAAVLAAIFSFGLCGSGCGEYYRPVANPFPLPGGDPQRTHHALVVSSVVNSKGSQPGTAVVIDVSGDTSVASFTVGRNPVYAAAAPTGTDYVVNQGDDSVAAFTLTGAGNPPTLVGLPTGAGLGLGTQVAAELAASAQSKLFVAEPGLNSVAVIDQPTNTLITEISVGPVSMKPVALVATPDGTQLYSLNEGSNDVTVILPANNIVFTTIQLPAGASPVWGAASADGSRVFVVNQGTSTVSVINTITDTVVSTLAVGTAPNYIVYDPTLNRAYVTSQAGLSIIDNNMVPVTVQTKQMAGAPCNALRPISVTALADGTRAYVADQTTNNVCVLNTTSNVFTKVVSVGTAPTTTSAITSDPDSTRVYAASSATLPIAQISRSSDVVTATTSNTFSSNPFAVGQTVVIADVADSTYDGQFRVASVSSPTQFTYSQSGADSFSSGGTATVGYVSMIQTSGDTLVTQNAGTNPLTISTGGTPTFITITP